MFFSQIIKGHEFLPSVPPISTERRAPASSSPIPSSLLSYHLRLLRQLSSQDNLASCFSFYLPFLGYIYRHICSILACITSQLDLIQAIHCQFLPTMGSHTVSSNTTSGSLDNGNTASSMLGPFVYDTSPLADRLIQRATAASIATTTTTPATKDKPSNEIDVQDFEESERATAKL
ncbi:hypothetical protein NCS52_01085900 [Fusarium sp. LHS14.1]|nr:hypothetical protein NCS52_01085900 [Fusarium sp. LHS14.1]